MNICEKSVFLLLLVALVKTEEKSESRSSEYPGEDIHEDSSIKFPGKLTSTYGQQSPKPLKIVHPTVTATSGYMPSYLLETERPLRIPLSAPRPKIPHKFISPGYPQPIDHSTLISPFPQHQNPTHPPPQSVIFPQQPTIKPLPPLVFPHEEKPEFYPQFPTPSRPVVISPGFVPQYPYPQRPTIQPNFPQRPHVIPEYPIQPQRPTIQPNFPQRPTLQPNFPQRPTIQPNFPQRPTIQPNFPQRPTIQPQFPVVPQRPQFPFPPQRPIEPPQQPGYPQFPEEHDLTHNIPGLPGKDYPTFAAIPRTDFQCDYPGFYADIHSGCQVWHYCQFDGRHDSFLCPNGTIFNQKYFVCDWWYNVDCESSVHFYPLNSNLYRESRTHGSVALEQEVQEQIPYRKSK